MFRPFSNLLLGLVLVVVYLGVYFEPSHEYLGTAEAARNFGSLCSSKEVAHGKSQAVSDIALHHTTSQEIPEATHLVAGFRPH